MGRNQTREARECDRLAAELRLLRERSGLTLVTLAEESAYSRSSWQRYLSGAALPPWLAVRALCHLAGEPEPRIRALWELAESAWSGRAVVAAPTAPRMEASPVPPSVRIRGPGPVPDAQEPSAERELSSVPLRRWAAGLRAVAAAAGLLLIAAVVTVLYADGHRGLGGASSHMSTASSGFHVACVGVACDGLDPQVTLCGVEPQTLLELLPASGPGLEVRYQPLCRAAWARTWNNRLGDRLTLSAPGARPQFVAVTDPHTLDAFAYTPMLALGDGRGPLKVCLTTSSPRSTICRFVPSPPSASSSR